MESYRITVVIPLYNKVIGLYNRLLFMSRCDENLVKFIIVDHDSNDGSSEIAKKFCESKKNFQYIWIPNIDKNPSEPRNIGLKLCDTDYIVFCDADDIIIPNNYEYIISIMDNNPNICCWAGPYCHSRVLTYNDSEYGLYLEYDIKYRNFKYCNIIDNIKFPTFLLNGDVFRKNHIHHKWRNEMQEDMLFGMEYLWNCKMSEYVYHDIEHCVYVYNNEYQQRVHEYDQMLNGRNYIEYTFELMKKYHPEFEEFLKRNRN